MEVRTYLGKMARKELLKQGKLIRLLQTRKGVAGCMFDDTGIDVHFRNQEKSIFVPFSAFPYTETELNAFHKARYVTDHPSFQKKVKREVTTIRVWNENEEMTIETTNPYAVDEITRQYEAREYLQGQCLVYGGTAIQMAGVIQAGYGYDVEKRVFENIVAYSQFQETVVKKKREW